jgi:hypothetical protein
MWLLLVPVLVILALIFSVGALFEGMFWLLGGAWPWVLIGLGAWMFWHQDGRHRQRRRSSVPISSAPVAASGSAAVSRRGQKPPSRKLRNPDLPIDVQVKVEQIRRKVDVLLGYADRFPPFSQDLHLVRQTATDYLPRTVNTFLSMKPEDVDKPLVSAGGKTAREELKAQLDLLDSKLDDITQREGIDTDRPRTAGISSSRLRANIRCAGSRWAHAGFAEF